MTKNRVFGKNSVSKLQWRRYMKSAKKIEKKSFLKSFRDSVVWDYLQVIVVAFILVFGFIRPFVVEAFKIPSGSMKDTLLEGDRILVCKFIYGIKIPLTKHKIFDFHEPQRGDIFVFIPPHERSKNFIKRIVAIEGDTVEVKGKTLYANGEPIDDSKYVRHIGNPYLNFDFPPFRDRYKVRKHLEDVIDIDYLLPYEGFKTNFPDGHPFEVPKGYVFAMGDNREESSDSRVWGPVSVEDIKGQAFMIYWSREPDNIQFLKFWEWHKWFARIRITRIGKIVRSQFDGT